MRFLKEISKYCYVDESVENPVLVLVQRHPERIEWPVVDQFIGGENTLKDIPSANPDIWLPSLEISLGRCIYRDNVVTRP